VAAVLAHGFNNTIGLVTFYLIGPIYGLWRFCKGSAREVGPPPLRWPRPHHVVAHRVLNRRRWAMQVIKAAALPASAATNAQPPG
jgi:hypothetical protein